MKILSSKNKKDNKILRTKTQKVDLSEIKGKEIKKIIDDLFKVSAGQGDSAGISAIQLGYLKRIFIVEPQVFEVDDEKNKVKNEDCVFINPKIIKHSKETIEFEEGCLSVRDYYGLVTRFKNVTLEAYNLEGKKIIRGADGLLSVIFQHEIDHLNGILFIDKAKNIRKLTPEEIEAGKSNTNNV